MANVHDARASGYRDSRQLGARLAFGPRPSREACVWLDDLGHSWLLDSGEARLELAGGILIAFVAAVRDLDDLRGRAA